MEGGTVPIIKEKVINGIVYVITEKVMGWKVWQSP